MHSILTLGFRKEKEKQGKVTHPTILTEARHITLLSQDTHDMYSGITIA